MANLKNNMQQPQCFLLGGHDLEMNEIKTILIDCGFKKGTNYFDKQLRWGANLSSYQDILNSNSSRFSKIYGIELNQDITPPKSYISIDHHGKFETKPASIEQIAQILGYTLTRNQLLIAANDKGYIPAMQEMGASSDEITKIRVADRKSQGIKKKDEVLAAASVFQNKILLHGVIIIYSLTDYFSAISDLLYPFEHLVIYNENTLSYSGKGKLKIVKHFSKLLAQNKAYYGGGNWGFFGIIPKVIDKEELKKIATEEIPKLLKDNS